VRKGPSDYTWPCNRKETFGCHDEEAAIKIEKTGELPETVAWTNTGFDRGMRMKGALPSYGYRFEAK